MKAQLSHQGHGLQLKGFDYLNLYVGNAVQASHFYRLAFGFTPTVRAGLETGLRDQQSLVLQMGSIRLVLTSPLGPESGIAEHVKSHGDGVKDIAFEVDDASQVFEQAVKRGARPLSEPASLRDQKGYLIKATIAGPGNIIHSFVQRRGYDGAFMPDFQPVESQPPARMPGITSIDHVAFGVERGTLDEWVGFYEQVFGFHQSHEENVSTEYSGMKSKVVESDTSAIRFPIVEPAPGRRKSQVEEYLTFHRGPGAQHLAFLTDDIVATVRALRANGIEFLKAPGAYYDRLEQRVGKLDADIATLRELNILVDRDPWGHLMQIFTKPVQSRPTFFIEIIQRIGARGFGGGNITALFEALEQEQALRGNL